MPPASALNHGRITNFIAIAGNAKLAARVEKSFGMADITKGCEAVMATGAVVACIKWALRFAML